MDEEIRFIDLFSGIGGFRLGLEYPNQMVRTGISQGRYSTDIEERESRKQPNNNRGFLQGQKTESLQRNSINSEGGQTRTNGFKCVWSCDNNKYANQVYTARFGEENHHSGDIRKVRASSIPDHDLLCAGFPCQAFSVAGKRHGFSDTRGTLFFEIARIARAKRPTLLLLENVKGLLSHDEGLTYQIILESLEELGYLVEWQVLNSKHYGVPQNRERVFIIGHLRGRSTRPIFPITEISGEINTTNGERPQTNIAPTIDRRVGDSTHFSPYVVIDPFNTAKRQDGMAGAIKTNQGSPTSTGTAVIVADRSRHLAEKGRNLESPKPFSNSLTAVPKDNLLIQPFIKNIPHGFNDGFEKTLPHLKANSGAQYNELLVNDARIRRLTPVECERLQGFPDGWTEGISNTQRYKCLGNAVTVNVIEFLGRKLRSSLSRRDNS